MTQYNTNLPNIEEKLIQIMTYESAQFETNDEEFNEAVTRLYNNFQQIPKCVTNFDII